MAPTNRPLLSRTRHEANNSGEAAALREALAFCQHPAARALLLDALRERAAADEAPTTTPSA